MATKELHVDVEVSNMVEYCRINNDGTIFVCVDYDYTIAGRSGHTHLSKAAEV